VPATTLDPNAKSSGIALSGGNLVATSSAAGNAASTRTLTGKNYFEAVITTLAGTPSIGLVNHIFAFSTALLGADANSLAFKSTGAVVVNGSTLATIATFAAGDRIDCAIDPASRLIWFRVNGGNWNNNGSNDPATGVGGIDLTSMNLGTLRAAVGASVTGTVWTAKFSTAFTGTAPSGYASLDGIQTSAGQATGVAAGPLASAPSFSNFVGQATIALPSNGMFTSTIDGDVSGVVKELGVAVAGRKVRVYDRATGELLGETTSAGDGSFSLSAQGRATVYVVALDSPYNALIFDGLAPV
jgi:hypothetical protein